MAEVRWTPQAADDLEAIAKFISTDSVHYARLFVMDIFQALKIVERFPRSGRIVPEVKDQCIREILLGNYRIVYRLHAEVAEVLTIYHAVRLLDPGTLCEDR